MLGIFEFGREREILAMHAHLVEGEKSDWADGRAKPATKVSITTGSCPRTVFHEKVIMANRGIENENSRVCRSFFFCRFKVSEPLADRHSIRKCFENSLFCW